MKKRLLLGLLTIGALNLHAQSDNYSAVGSYGANVRTVLTVPFGCGLTPSSATSVNAGTIAVNTTTGHLEFTNVPGACEHRIAKPLGNIYDDSFTLDFEVNVTGTNPAKGFFPVVLTSQNVNPTYTVPMTTCLQNNPIDLLGVLCSTPSGNNNLFPTLQIQVGDNGTITTSAGSIPIVYGTTYFGHVVVYGNQRGEFFLYSDVTHTTLVDHICFDYPSTVRGLAFMQHSMISGYGFARNHTAWVDNTNVFHSDDAACCNITFDQSNIVCTSKLPATFSATSSNGSPVTLSITSPGVTYSSNANGSVTVTSWGTMNAAPKEVTFSAVMLCQCDVYSETFTVYVHPTLNAAFNISGLGTSGSQLTNFSAISTFGMPGIGHNWEMYTSNVSATPITLIRGPYVSTGGSGSTFSINATTPSPTLMTNTYYLVRHTVYFEDGLCNPMVSNRLIYESAGMKLLEWSEEEYERLGPDEIERQVAAANAGIMTGSNGVSIYPNPSSGKMSINSPEVIRELQLLDINGKLLGTQTPEAAQAMIDLSGKPRGTYLVKIITANGSTLEKIVKE